MGGKLEENLKKAGRNFSENKKNFKAKWSNIM